jgi:hypothetical protein
LLDGLALTAADLSASRLDTGAQLDFPGDLPEGSVGGQLLHDFDGELAIAHGAKHSEEEASGKGDFCPRISRCQAFRR